jgi:hypothetical protein
MTKDEPGQLSIDVIEGNTGIIVAEDVTARCPGYSWLGYASHDPRWRQSVTGGAGASAR